jgi:hypothetical protein
MEPRGICRHATGRIDRRELHMLDLGGVRRHDAQYCAKETLVCRQRRLDRPVRTAADIRRAKAEGKTGIILGFQNTSALEDQIGYISLFKELGVGVMQITNNTQNLAGAGCYERRDTGLSGFGHEIVAEMNRVGVLCDLSHVGAVTSRDVIIASKRPVRIRLPPAASQVRTRPYSRCQDRSAGKQTALRLACLWTRRPGGPDWMPITLKTGRRATALPGPVFHRQDRVSFA